MDIYLIGIVNSCEKFSAFFNHLKSNYENMKYEIKILVHRYYSYLPFRGCLAILQTNMA